MAAKKFNPKSFATLIGQFVEQVLDDVPEAPHVLISPLVWQPRSNGQRHWYFMVAAGTEFRLNEFGADDKALARNMRASLTQALMQRQPPIVIHDFDDELEMMCWSEVLWPCAKTREIVAGIEAERAQWSTA